MALLTSQGQPWHLQGTLGWWGLFWQDLCLGLAALWLQDDNLGGYSALTLWLCISPEVVSSWGTPAEKQWGARALVPPLSLLGPPPHPLALQSPFL